MEFSNLKIKNIELVINYKPTKNSWIAKNRTDHIIGIQMQGKEFHDLGYKSFTIDDNCIFFLNQKDDFNVSVEEFGYCYSIHFTTFEPVDTDSFCIKITNSDEIRLLIEKIERQSKLDYNSSHKLYSNVYRLLAIFNDIFKKSYTPSDLRMVNAKEYIDLHFCEPDCLKIVNEQSGMSQRHFYTLFKNNFDTTPNRYITSKKIQLAKKLLSGLNLSIEQISQMCGFCDVYYFSKVFKTETNLTPSAYKQGQSQK